MFSPILLFDDNYYFSPNILVVVYVQCDIVHIKIKFNVMNGFALKTYMITVTYSFS